ncbi:class E sortase [Streptomyces polygonati]|uniref:Class E sortase n=1 Tax=Streptomyces polygonati TaxID=1617087 RepID=A0ABV8HN95_9ACTN
MRRTRAVVPALAATLVVGLAGAAAARTGDHPAGQPAAARAPVAQVAAKTPGGPPPAATEPRIINASMAIPSIGIRSLAIVPYQGTTDDAPGTRIQDRGIAASPFGPNGGVGPGQVGNYLVTGHRDSAGGPLHMVPSLKNGQQVVITAGGKVYTYKITQTRVTDFRSPSSLVEQRAAVPGFPGRTPTQAMITVSTCATLEDHAAGNFWHDAEDNPQHRIDKIGVLVSTRPAS